MIGSLGVSLIGRELDLEELRSWALSDSSHMTLTGPPGVGKTALAVHFFAECFADSHFRVVVCDAAECADLSEFYSALRRAIGVTTAAESDPDKRAETMAAVLREFPTAILLDNMEELAEAVGPQIAIWTESASELKILVTSRCSLGTPTEVLKPVMPLSLSPGPIADGPAAQLFLREVSTRSSGAAEMAQSDLQFRDLLGELDGLPLALELAAARCRLMTPSDLLKRLQENRGVLARGTPDASPRRSLLQCLAVSYGLLTDLERRVFAQVSTFRGGFSATAAGEVVDLVDGAVVLDTLESLKDHSLLFVDYSNGVRCSMLASVQAFAQEQAMKNGQWDAVQRRHLQWARSIAQEQRKALETGIDAEAPKVMRAELANLSAAARFGASSDSDADRNDALLIYDGLWTHGRFDGDTTTYHAAIEALLVDSSAPASLRARMHLRLVRGYLWTEGSETATRHLESAQQLGDTLGDNDFSIRIMVLRSLYWMTHNDTDEAIRILLAALLVDVAVGSATTFEVHDALVNAYRQAGDAAKARRHGELALQCAGEEGSLKQAPLLTSMSFAASEGGEFELAEALAQKGLAILDRFGVRRNRLRTGLELASARALQLAGKTDEALRILQEVRDIARRTGELSLCSYGEFAMGTAYVELDQATQARENYASAVGRLCANDPYRACGAAMLAAVEARLGQMGEAAHWIAEAQSVGHCGIRLQPLIDAVATLIAYLDGRADQLRLNQATTSLQTSTLPIEGRALALLIARVIRGGDSERRQSSRLLIGPGAGWIEISGATTIACARRPVMKRLILALARNWRETPEVSMSTDELRDAGWPNEQMRPESARRRVEVMISRMRDLGLRDALETTQVGYRFDPKCHVLFTESEKSGT